MAIVNIFTQSDVDFVRGFTYRYRSDLEPVDLTGYQMRMSVRTHATAAVEYLLLTTENRGIFIYNPVGGQFSINISNKHLLRLPSGTYVHSLVRIREATNLRIRVWGGQLIHTAGPSRNGLVSPLSTVWDGEQTYISRPSP